SIAPRYVDEYLKVKYYRLLYQKLGEAVDKYIKGGMWVLDVGAGIGCWSQNMQKRGASDVSFDKSKEPVLTIKESRLGKIERGIVVEISPNKVPRVIGKKGSMVKLLEELLEVNIIVCQNGRVLVVGRNEKREELAAIVIKKIEAEAHTEGLTSKVREYIKARLT
ncbi:MAG: KH domain-containing protein, partial [Thermofilum sp.]